MQKWHSYWSEYGKQRDMPAFTCAIQKSLLEGLKLNKWTFRDRVFNPSDEDDSVIVQHYYKDHRSKSKKILFYDKFSSNYIKKDKSFDLASDWKNVLL